MISFIAIILFGIFLCISAIHFYWAFGGKWGGDAVLPSKDDNVTKVFIPSMAPTLIVGLGLLAIGVFILVSAGFIHLALPIWIDKYGLWMIAGVFTLRAVGDFKYMGFFKTIRHTKFGKYDTKYYSPLCLVIGGLAIILKLSLS